MAEHPHAALIRRGYDAFSRGDMETIAAIFADDIEWNIPGRSPLAGQRKGKTEVFDFFAQLSDLTENTFAVELVDVLANDDHVVALTHETARRADRVLDIDGAHIWRVHSDKAVSFTGLASDQYAEDEFYG